MTGSSTPQPKAKKCRCERCKSVRHWETAQPEANCICRSYDGSGIDEHGNKSCPVHAQLEANDEQDAERTFIRFSSEFDGPRLTDQNGVERVPQSEPFAVQTRLGGWQPICIRHKLVFKDRKHYDDHWTPVCENFDYKECPPSDLKKHLKGYSKA